MRVGIYVRVSTSQQEDGTSLSTQEERCRAAVKLSGYDVVEEFVWHESWTGADLERPMLDRMRRAMREGVVDAVFVPNPDRLSRDPLHLLMLVQGIPGRRSEPPLCRGKAGGHRGGPSGTVCPGLRWAKGARFDCAADHGGQGEDGEVR